MTSFERPDSPRRYSQVNGLRLVLQQVIPTVIKKMNKEFSLRLKKILFKKCFDLVIIYLSFLFEMLNIKEDAKQLVNFKN